MINNSKYNNVVDVDHPKRIIHFFFFYMYFDSQLFYVGNGREIGGPVGEASSGKSLDSYELFFFFRTYLILFQLLL